MKIPIENEPPPNIQSTSLGTTGWGGIERHHGGGMEVLPAYPEG